MHIEKQVNNYNGQRQFKITFKLFHVCELAWLREEIL